MVDDLYGQQVVEVMKDRQKSVFVGERVAVCGEIVDVTASF